MNPASLAQLLEADPLADFQAAIVGGIKTLITGITVQAHPGKADIGELIAKTVVTAPGISIGWSRMRRVGYPEGGYTLNVEWIAYIVAEAKAVANKRVESSAVAFAIGSRLLEILDEEMTSLWGMRGVLPPETTPAPELKPMFTVKDQAQGTIYYAVTWTQGVADLGRLRFPDNVGEADPDNGTINYESEADIDAIKQWLPALEVEDGEE